VPSDSSTGPIRVPLSVWVLAASTFVLGTSEFVVAGLLPQIAADLHVSVPHAGLLISAFAIAMVLGAPAMAVLTLRLPRRTTLLSALGVFAAGNVLAALAADYDLLLVARVVTAVATGAFWAVAAVLTVSLAGERIRARALAVLVGGLTVSNIVGVPLGTFVGQRLGWQAAFWTVAILAAAVSPVVLLLVPNPRTPRVASPVRAEAGAFRSGRLWLALATTAAFQGGTIAMFSYVAPLLTDVTGLPASALPVVLAAFGVGNMVGIHLGGRFADRYPWRTLLGGLVGTIVVLAALASAARDPYVAVPLLLLFGVLGFSLAAPLNARVFALAGPAPTLASAVNASAFNVGNTVGPWLGGIVIGVGLGYAAPSWVGAALLSGALALGTVSRRLDRRYEPVRAEPYADHEPVQRPECLQGDA
jgi:MFS transporter, DHA1 family, chloramphenicol resistance protein